MNRWKIELTKSALKEFRQLSEGVKREAAELFEDLVEDPAIVPSIEMRGHKNMWRSRFYSDRYRMVYRILKAEKRIRVIRIRPRSTAYDGMKH